MAQRRSLQVAGYANQWGGRKLYYWRSARPRKIQEMGGDSSLYLEESVISLDTFGAEAVFRYFSTARTRYRRSHLRRDNGETQIARIPCAWAVGTHEREGNLHDRRSGRRATASPDDCRRRLQYTGLSGVPARRRNGLERYHEILRLRVATGRRNE